MENNQDSCKLLYNTERKCLRLPEYGRNVQKMIEYIRSIPDREKRNEQARAVVKVMEILNPQVHLQENYEQKLWDHLHIISGFDLDIDSPYPIPSKEQLVAPPATVPIKKKPIKANHYGRNIESIIDLIAEKEDSHDTFSRHIYETAVSDMEQGQRGRRDDISGYRKIVRLQDKGA